MKIFELMKSMSRTANFFCDKETGLKGITAIHNTNLVLHLAEQDFITTKLKKGPI